MNFLRDIQERQPGLASAPQPPTLPTSHGFPSIPHRSQRISAFKRARNEKQASSQETEIPAVKSTTSVASHPIPNGKSFTAGEALDVEVIIASVQEENMTKVKRMSERERVEELEELEMQVPSGLLDILRRRAEKKREHAAIEDETAVLGDEGQNRMPAGADGMIGGESTVPGEVSESEPTSTPTPPKTASTKPKVAFNPILSSQSPKIVRQHLSNTPSSYPTTQTSTQQIHDLYFPNEALEQPALEWIQKPLSDGPSVSSQHADGVARFDLSGNVLSEEAARDLPVTRGLHHHGDEASKAGYTIGEVLILSSSTYGPQRVMMLGLFGKIVGKLGGLIETVELGLKGEKKEVVEKAWLLACGILGSKEKNSGMLREAISLWHAVLSTSSKEEVSIMIKLVDSTSVFSRVEDLLDDPISSSSLSAPSILQLVSCLRLLAESSAKLARLISSQVDQLIHNFVLSLQWPDLHRNSGVSWEIALCCVSILRECIERHRDMATAFARNNVFESLLKFLALPPWRTRSSEDRYDGYEYELVEMVLEVFEKVTRYGLKGSLLTKSGETFMEMGEWLRELPIETVQSSEVLLRTYTTYFKVVRTWTVAAKDPHSMVNDHELIWSQVEGCSWAEEAMHVVRMTWARSVNGKSSSSESVGIPNLAKAALDVLSAWIDAVKLNSDDPQLWIDRIGVLAREVGFAGWVNSTLSRSDFLELSECRLRLLDTVFRLIIHLDPDNIDSAENVSPAALSSAIHQAPARRIILTLLIHGRRSDLRGWVRLASAYLSNIHPGEEQDGLRVVDILLDLKWDDTILQSVTHRHGLYILRPFYHYAIMPNLETILSPHHPEGKLLKVTTCLKADDLDGEGKANLPLSSDWMLSTLDEQLRPASSLAFKQVPPAWDASPKELVEAALAMYQLFAADDAVKISQSSLLVNLMKVFMLEIRDEEGEQGSETEIFREATVSRQLETIIAGTTTVESSTSTETLETASERFLAPGTTFFQWYSDFHELYQSISFSDQVFGQLLLPPLAQRYPVDYRRLFWTEQTGALRTMRLRMDRVPLEHGRIEAYFLPAEQDRQILSGQLTGLAKAVIGAGSHEFLYSVAIWHISNAIWSTTPILSSKAVYRTLVSAGRTDVWDDVLRCNCSAEREDFAVSSSEIYSEVLISRRTSAES